MKKFLVILVVLLLVSAFLVSACQTSTPTPASTTAKPPATTSASPVSATTAPPTTAPVAVKTLKFSYTMPKGASIAAGFEWFGPQFEKATNGRYKVEIYPSSQLVATNAILDSIKSGAVEMAYTSAGTYPSQFPLTLVLGPPALGFPGGNLKMYIAGHDAFAEFVNTTPEVANEYKDFILIQPMMLDPYNLVSKKKEIKSAADFKGLKVGGSGPKMEMVVANGGAKVQMIPPQSYENLDKGVVDAGFVTFGQVNDYKLTEVCDFFSAQDFGSGNGMILMNPAFYNAMGSTDQKILRDTMRAAMDVASKGTMDSIDTGIKLIQSAGKKVYTPTADEAKAWEAAAGPSIDQWKKDAKTAGASDATIESVLAKWKTIRAKYLAIGSAP